MGKVANFFKAIPSIYYDWRKRNEKIDALLNNYNSTLDLLTKLQSNFDDRTNELRSLQDDVRTIITILDTVTHGTKMELFETLHNWRELLVVKRGWASPEEKKEITEIYTIYHDKLNGNGNGERYYKEIIELPESLEELKARQSQGRS